MISKEQMDTLIGRLRVYGSESGRGKDHPNAIACRTAASVIIEQQAEIERLRDALRKIMGKDGYIDATPRGDRKVMYGEMGLIARTALGATQ